MAISPYFTDDDLISQLRVQFSREQMFDLDWKTIFGLIVERDRDFFLRFRGRMFSIDKITGVVTEIK